jgi:hypothetical protein
MLLREILAVLVYPAIIVNEIAMRRAGAVLGRIDFRPQIREFTC